ncbi:tetratricopeptide repeat protein [Aeromonas caviae]|uniref:tetratricopeptide repeat protein n=1 Tax=Aeromonas caviae TaxID=648 RepID=UPI00177FABC2|nr:tetratricopeptide repeat protein [Aeromonas caviae]MCY9813732.1 tetratricopeptide repeat protein [Aeromonas caviae]MDX7762989.1 tetratricopeptide repeat protein [Aeromonas caviae]MDX7786984.1 tetratricopeptide repeat protein [Aeromonas caviae]
MQPTIARWLFIALIALVIWRLIPLSTEQELAAANRAWRTGHFDEATRIWTPLAEQGQPRAQALMGWSHEVGQGSEQDMDRAIRLYRQAAQAGDAFGQYRLGEVYLRGAGVKRDLHEAFRWMELAARNGDVPAMLKVGILHLMGVNGRVELAEAKQWLYQASQKGNKMALQVLQEMALAEEGRSAFDFNGQSFLNAG